MSVNGKSNNIEKELASYIKNHAEEIARASAQKIFSEIPAYRKSALKQEESAATCLSFIECLILYLENENNFSFNKNILIERLIQFEEGVAARRLRYLLDLDDMLKAVLLFKNVLWKHIKNFCGAKQYGIEEFFIIENKINDFFMNHMIDLTDAYIKIQKEFMLSQEATFKKWEKVVESAYNIELNIPCREAYAAVARIQAEAIARRLRFDDEKVYDIKMAVGEACGNAIEHGSSRRGVDIHYHITPTDLIIEVRDYGQGFEPPKEEIDLPLDLFSERGRGLFLMKALVEKVDIESYPGEGTLIVLDKKR